VEGWAWQWIFWINVPIGLILLPIAWRRVEESYGPNERLDLVGVVLASLGLFGVVWGLVRGQGQGWTSPEIVSSLAIGVVLVAAFLAWERRAQAPMLPLRFFRNRTFALTNAASFAMYFGMFGAVFLLAQFFQVAQGDSPLTSGLKILPWTAMPVVVAPLAGALADRVIPGPRIVAVGLALQSIGLFWLASIATANVDYMDLVIPFVLSGMGMGLFFAPVANVIMSSVRPIEEGQASGTNNAIRELGGVFGVAVLASVFASRGGYDSPHIFSTGMQAATTVGATVVALGALLAFAVPTSPMAPVSQEASVEVG
jgi:EmrB/QacA subfamily drug resistance transporter